MMLEPIQYALGGCCGALVGLTLGLIGGGGSVLAVPLMVYLVGVRDPHIAIGTSAFSVAANAVVSLFQHARAGTVKWRCGGMYAAAGVIGALAGSTLGKRFDGQNLLLLFALVMIVIGVLMLMQRKNPGQPGVECTIDKAPKVMGYGLATGVFSGFLGIGGGFLVVPGLVGSTGMPMLNAVGTSLVAVAAFGLTTAFNYAVSALVDWPLALVFIGGGALGGFAGTTIARRISAKTGSLSTVFAFVVFAVAVYTLVNTIGRTQAGI